MSVGCTGGDVDYNLKITTTKVEDALTKVNDLFTTYLSLARQAGLPPDVMRMMRLLQQARVVIQMVIRSIELLYTATGPVGWLLALGSVGVSLFAYSDLLGEMQG